MKIRNEAHLSYCTNIHPGESWEEVFASLKQYTLAVKEKMAPETDFGIGLRLSYESAVTLSQAENCSAFKNWLDENKTYVFTINGFPYGNFHGQQVKDQVHAPDWLSHERVNYTCMLFDLLAQLLPKGMEGGISTSPLSYKYWYAIEEDRDLAKKKSCEHLVAVVLHLVQLNKWTGKKMHLDIEPEPDGLLENTDDFIDFFQNYLLKDGVIALIRQLKCTGAEARHYIREHLQLCYDVCHFAVAFETGHFSNGQSGAAFDENLIDGTPAADSLYQHINEHTDLAAILNRKSGNFSTNYTEIMVKYLHVFKVRNNYALSWFSAEAGWTRYHDYLLYMIPIGGYTENDIALYGKNFYHFNLEYMRRFKKGGCLDRAKLNVNYEYLYKPHASVTRSRIEIIPAIYFKSNVGIYGKIAFGHDNYNYRFVDNISHWGIGLTYDLFPSLEFGR
ncbi:MAG: hypothetical protein ABS44_21265 [Chryseobacterium sp. SCN 40-13]|nr:MAG: hypothetical protein ABS44_21265 [Chryseobacterium sp. SCN 40-13]